MQAGYSCTSEAASTVYRCWREALDRAEDKARVSVTVREGDALLLFEIVGALSGANLDDLRDRVAAFGGTLTLQAEDGGEVRISGSLPVPQ